MRTSLIEIKNIEDYLLSNALPPDKLLFEAKILIDQDLKEKTALQKQVYRLCKLYGRKKLREEIEEVHFKLFNTHQHEDFKTRILNLFQK